MKIRLSFLALGLVALLGSLLASSSRISAYAATDWLSASPAAGPSVLGTGKTPLGGVSAASRTMVTSTLYLPVVMKDYVQGIYGYLTQGGAPVSAISLELRFYNGSSYSTAATATTNSSGFYLFTGIPALGGGQFYYVRYTNPENNNSRLSFWGSARAYTFTTTSSVNLGTSDLANIALVSPAPWVTVALPRLFQWSVRPATPSDNYFFELFDPSGPADVIVGPLYYVGTYNLTSLPTGFYPNVQYGWSVELVDANGGTGFSYYYNPIKFSNSGASVHSSLNIAPQPTGRRDDLPPHPHPAE